MTIIEPSKNKYFANEFLYIGILLLITVFLSIYFYNQNVNFKYRIGLYEKSIPQLEVFNADLRNQLYQTLDPKNLTTLMQKQNLVSDKNPEYLEHKTLASR